MFTSTDSVFRLEKMSEDGSGSGHSHGPLDPVIWTPRSWAGSVGKAMSVAAARSALSLLVLGLSPKSGQDTLSHHYQPA